MLKLKYNLTVVERLQNLKKLSHEIKNAATRQHYGTVYVTDYKCKESDKGAYAEVCLQFVVLTIIKLKRLFVSKNKDVNVIYYVSLFNSTTFFT